MPFRQPKLHSAFAMERLSFVAWLAVSVLIAGATPCTAQTSREPPMTNTPVARCCPVVELRQYTLKPGQRDVLIDLFEREFIEPQEAAGMRLVGQFRDLDRPDRFVWIRGFADMPSRAQSLQAFYGGPIWQGHRDAANATMIDSDNVLLLRPVSSDSAFASPVTTRAPVGAAQSASSRIVATVYYLDEPIDEAFEQFFDRDMAPALAAEGGQPIARFETESAENTFPRLPVRTGEHVFIWFARFEDAAELRDYEARLASSERWTKHVQSELARRLKSPPERIVLEPTARSLLR